jgi:hypothetical protein
LLNKKTLYLLFSFLVCVKVINTVPVLQESLLLGCLVHEYTF